MTAGLRWQHQKLACMGRYSGSDGMAIMSMGFGPARIGVGNMKVMVGGNSDRMTRVKGVGDRGVTGNAARCRATGGGEAVIMGTGSRGEAGDCGSDSQPGGIGRAATMHVTVDVVTNPSHIELNAQPSNCCSDSSGRGGGH